MKNFILFLLIFISLNSFSQEKIADSIHLNGKNFSNTYILDSAYQLRLPYKWSNTDGRVNFLLIDNGFVLLTSSMTRVGRMRTDRIYGELDGFKITTNEENQKVIHFFVRGRQYNAGKVMSFEITTIGEDKYIIKYFNKLGDTQLFFKARFPTAYEENEITKLINSF